VCCIDILHILILSFPGPEDSQKVAQTMGREQANIVNEGRDSPGGECSTREANQEDLVTVLVVVTYESVGLSNVIRDT
jgi:hypothetical protein